MRAIIRLVPLTVLAMVVPATAAAASSCPPPPHALRMPTLARDDHTITVAWRDPADRAAVSDYHVYRDGRMIGRSSQDPTATAKPYIDSFYAGPASATQLRVLRDTFTATGLAPATRYRFTVRSVDAHGHESRDTAPLFATTTPVSPIVDVTDYGAVGDGRTLDTEAIQQAIDACVPGGERGG